LTAQMTRIVLYFLAALLWHYVLCL
jgi:hypothetical protein